MKIDYSNGEIVISIPAAAQSVKLCPQSRSGKTRMVASTAGFVAVDGAPQGVRPNLNVTAAL